MNTYLLVYAMWCMSSFKKLKLRFCCRVCYGQ